MTNSQKSILVVDDDQDMLKIVSKTLAMHDYKCYVAEDGRMAKYLLGQNKIDLLITDIFMPEVDGIELIRNVNKYHPEIVILAMSAGWKASTQAGDRYEFLHDAAEIGAHFTIQKPFQMKKLLKVVANIFSQ